MASQNVKIMLKNVQCAFIAFDKPKQGKDDSGNEGEAKYGGTFLLNKKSKAGKRLIAMVEDAIEEVKEAKWGDNQPKLKESKLCLRDGDDEDYDGFEGHMYVRASNASRPTLLTRSRGVAEKGLFYSGCFVNAIVTVWAQDNKYGKRVNATFEGAQYVSEGEHFGRAPVSADEFEDLGDDEDDMDDEDDSRSKKSSKKSKKPRDDEEDEDDEDERPSRKSKDKKSSKKSKKSRDDEDEEDDEDEDERPKRKSKDKKSSKKKPSRYEEDDEDEDDDI